MDIRAQISEASELRDQGKYSEAIEALSEMLILQPQSSELHAIISHCYILAGQIEKAEKHLTQAKRLEPNNKTTELNLIRLELKKGNKKIALDKARQFNILTAYHVEGLSVLGACLRINGQFIESIEILNNCIDLDQNYCDAFINRGLSYLALKNKKMARIDLEEAHTKNSHFKPVWHLLLSLVIEAEEYDKALSLAVNMLELDSTDQNLFAIIALCYQKKGQYDKALTAYEQAIKINPSIAELHNNKGIILKKKGNLELAKVSFQKAATINVKFIEAYINIGVILKQQGKLIEAEDMFLKALSINPDSAEANNNIGTLFKLKGNLARAREYYEKSISVKPDFAEAMCNLGNIYNESGNFESALKLYQRALSLEPNNTKLSTDLGIILFENLKYKEAAERFKLDSSLKSQSYLLKCFYELDNENKFFEQYKSLVNKGFMNCVLGSYASRASKKYGITARNPFCNYPLNYVHSVDLKKNYKFDEIFVHEAVKVLNMEEVNYKSQGHLKNGIQTSGNIFKQSHHFETEIQNLLRNEITRYRDKFSKSDEGFLQNWPERYNLSGWLISMNRGGELAAHIHDTGWITGSVYINVPNRTNKHDGNLVVATSEHHDIEINLDECKSIAVETGTLCLFPSSLLHYTVPFESEEKRIVLAFDLIPCEE